jgi:hypothetical protein
MNFRHSIASIGLVGALACGLAATASVVTSDSMSNAVTAGGVLHRSLWLDEVGAHHSDDNGDDITAISLNGLAVEIELPRETELPPKSTFDTPNV